MRRTLLIHIVRDVTDHSLYFQLGNDCTGRVDKSALINCTSAICQLTYDTIPDALDEYLQLGARTSCDSLEYLCKAIGHIWIWVSAKSYLY